MNGTVGGGSATLLRELDGQGRLAVSVDGVFYIPCYDHSGNIVLYVSEAGNIAAQYTYDPFSKLDQDGVGKLMEMALRLGRGVRPKLHCGICGEHGGDPASVEFCHKLGLDYVSCSPYRVPIARLAAAQAALRCK